MKNSKGIKIEIEKKTISHDSVPEENIKQCKNNKCKL